MEGEAILIYKRMAAAGVNSKCSDTLQVGFLDKPVHVGPQCPEGWRSGWCGSHITSEFLGFSRT